MTERWKPEEGERYYFIGADGKPGQTVFCERYESDPQNWELGNCFKTEKEAQAAAEKVKALLFGLHELNTDCTQLPKLTTEVFDHPGCPEWAQYAAVDKGGHAYWYRTLPKNEFHLFTHQCVWYNKSTSFKLIPGKFDASDWKNSLVERPSKLPGWCTVGAWVFIAPENVFGHTGYKKIQAIDGLGLVFADGSCIVFSDKIKQTRLRPYNAEEMRGLVGKIVEDSPCGYGKNYSLVTAYHSGVDYDEPPTVLLLDEWTTADDLLCDAYCIDGHPCGVLEHLDAGEWVE